MIDVYVPKVGTSAEQLIDSKSGIVGQLAAEDRVAVYYEGNRYGYSNVRTFADRVMIAASRMTARYPTIARAWLNRSELILVGQFDGERILLNNSEALCDWLATHDIDAELVVSRA